MYCVDYLKERETYNDRQSGLKYIIYQIRKRVEKIVDLHSRCSTIMQRRPCLFFTSTPSADSGVGRENLVIKHTVSHFQPNPGGIAFMSGRTQRGALIRHQSEKIKILNILFLRVEIESTTCCVYSHTLVSLHPDSIFK